MRFFSLSQERSHDLIELFTSGQVSGVEIRDKFHSPCNALMLQSDAQDCFNMLVWGIEAVQDPATQNVSISLSIELLLCLNLFHPYSGNIVIAL